MQKDDELLVREINMLADQAENANRLASLDSVALTLASQFEHWSEDEIKERLKAVWRERHLYWN